MKTNTKRLNLTTNSHVNLPVTDSARTLDHVSALGFRFQRTLPTNTQPPRIIKFILAWNYLLNFTEHTPSRPLNCANANTSTALPPVFNTTRHPTVDPTPAWIINLICGKFLFYSISRDLTQAPDHSLPLHHSQLTPPTHMAYYYQDPVIYYRWDKPYNNNYNKRRGR